MKFGGDMPLASNPIISHAQTVELVDYLNAFFQASDEIYAGRHGSIMICTQAAYVTALGSTAKSIGYNPPRSVVSLDLPYGAVTPDIGFSTDALARCAISDFMDGQKLFRGQPNRHLDSGIYYPIRRFWAKDNPNPYSLTVIESSEDRFLVGYADDRMQKDKSAEYEIAPIAIAWLLTWIFRTNVVLQQSYDWIVRNCRISLREIITIEETLEGICANSAHDA